MSKKNSKTKKLKANTKKLVLLDAHAIIHRAYHALPDFATSSGEPTGALYGLATMLIKIIGDLKPDYIVACFDLPGPTHRHDAYDEYKAGRAKTDDNLVLQLERAKDVFRAWGIPIYSHEGFEADDIIGTITHELKGDGPASTRARFDSESRRGASSTRGGETDIIIASGDMDTLQLVDKKRVQVFTLKRGLNDTVIYDEKGVEDRFGFPPKLLPDYKGLRGDPSDNIIGVKGVGEKTATSLIQTWGTVENIYKELKKSDDAYKKAGITERIKGILLDNEEEALFSKTLATIRIDAPINFSLPADWRECLEIEKLLDLFQKLEFRTLGERVKKVVGSDDGSGSSHGGDEINTNSAVLTQPGGRAPTTDGIGTGLSAQEEKELLLMLWVVDSNFTSPTLEEVERFTKTKDMKEAREILEKELDERDVRKVYEEIEKPIIPVVEAMNERGILVDKLLLEKLSKDYHQKLDKIEKEIWKQAGEEFNVNSPKVLSEILFEKLNLAGKRQKKTPGGALSTKESELQKIKDKHPIVGLVLEYRELSKLLSTYIDAIPPLLDKGSRLHSTFVQSGAATGRMASQNPNLQNIPIKTDLGRVIRDAFIAEEGYKLVALDYSQIELRIAAILSGDEKFLEIFKNGIDVHTGVAARVFGVEESEVDKPMRIKAKTINFGILYGMGVNALKTNLGTDRKEAQEFYNEYFKTFTGLASYLDEVKKDVAKKGYTETLFGRKRYFSGFNSPLPYVRAQAERMAINAPIQGTNADIIKIAMKSIDEYLEKKGLKEDVRLVMQIHDELVYEVKEERVAEVAEKLREEMESVLGEKERRGVPIVVDAQVGDNWGNMNPVRK